MYKKTVKKELFEDLGDACILLHAFYDDPAKFDEQTVVLLQRLVNGESFEDLGRGEKDLLNASVVTLSERKSDVVEEPPVKRKPPTPRAKKKAPVKSLSGAPSFWWKS